MSEELERLQKIGVQKISEDTHIPIHHIRSLLDADFIKFPKIQFLGFVSILQREYKENLDSLKKAGEDFYKEQETTDVESSLFVHAEKTSNKKLLYGAILLALFMLIIIYKLTNQESKAVVEEQVDNRLIETVQQKIEPKKIILADINSTQDSNKSVEKKAEVKTVIQTPKKERVFESFKITTKSKVWFGYIDLASNKKSQLTLKEKISLDPSKDWLLIFGHSFIKMYVDGEVQKFQGKGNVRFLYKDGILTTITADEFKKLNRGKKW